MDPDRVDLSGVLIPTATPFRVNDGELDLAAFRSNLRHWLASGVRGVVLTGSTGEAVLLDEKERIQLLEAGRELVPEDLLMVAGTGGESTRVTLRRTLEAADLGSDAVLIQPPSFYRGQMTSEVLRDHYRALADASPVPVILYQVPLRYSTLEFSTGLVAQLSEHPNVIGIKDSRGDLKKLGDLLDQVQAGFQVMVGTGAKLYASLEMGAVGGILGVANLAPRESAEIVSAFHAGRVEEAGAIQERLAPLHDGIVGGFGVAGVKAALDILGMAGGAPRPPLQPLGESGTEKVRGLLAAAAFPVS